MKISHCDDDHRKNPAIFVSACPKVWFRDEGFAKAECNFVGVANFKIDATTEKIAFWWSDLFFLVLVLKMIGL